MGVVNCSGIMNTHNSNYRIFWIIVLQYRFNIHLSSSERDTKIVMILPQGVLGATLDYLIDYAAREAMLIHRSRHIFQTEPLQVIGDPVENNRLCSHIVGI